MLAAAIAIILAIGLYLSLRSPSDAYIRGRESDTNLWRSAYANQPAKLIDAVLLAICDAFLLSRKDPHKLRPSDPLIEIYRAAYPNDGPDTLEFEELLEALQQDFRVPAEDIGPVELLTVGDVVALCIKSADRSDRQN